MAEANAQNETTQTGQFAIQKIYVKDVSFETPHSPQVFRTEWKPSVNMEMANNANHLENNLYEVVLAITLTVSVEEKTAYLIEVNQAGIFHIEGFPKEAMERITSTVCSNILFPFAREAIADLIARGGFQQLLLAPVNFDALYAQQQKQKQQEAQSTKH